MSYSFHWNPHFKRKRKAGLQRAQRAIDSSVLRFSEPFLPFQSGVLRNSGITGTVVGSGRVQWTRWFDRMKRVHTADIVAEANRAYRGGRVL